MRACRLLEGDAQLHAGEVGTEAEVVAAAEGEVLVRLAVEVDDVGGELGVVVVGGAQHERDAVALLDLHVVDVGPGRPGGHHHHRREPAQQLLDGGRDERRIVDEPLPLLGVGGEVLDHAVERGRDGVEPTAAEQVADAEQLRLVEGRPSMVAWTIFDSSVSSGSASRSAMRSRK